MNCTRMTSGIATPDNWTLCDLMNMKQTCS